MSDVKQQNCGIYKIKNLINGKVYIGQSVNIRKRWDLHRFYSKEEHKNYPESNKPLYNAIRKYGIENFSFEVIEYCLPEELNDKEIYWIDYYNSFNDGYNLTLGGQKNPQLYNYKEIYEKWEEGYKCKELMEIFHCGDQVITNALRAFGVSEDETRSRSLKKKKVVALSMDGESLRIFDSILDAARFIYKKENKKASSNTAIPQAIKNNWSWKGYYWEFLNETNHPKENISDEEFFSKQKIRTAHQWTKEERDYLSTLNRKVERPSREELKKLIRTKSFISIGESFGVSDNTIRKWCDRYELPRRKKDINTYSDEEWNKI